MSRRAATRPRTSASAGTSSEAQELAYLENTLGFTAAGAAGALGNLQQESDFSPTAVQAGSGASGIAQWQDGRLAALRAFAASRGTTIWNLGTQLAFLGHELNTSYQPVLAYERSATSPTAAAAEWNAHYEISADTSDDRETNAANIYSQIAQGTTLTGGGSASPTTAAAAAAGSSGPVVETGIVSDISGAFSSAGETIGRYLLIGVIVLGGVGLVVVGLYRTSGATSSDITPLATAALA